MRGKAGAGRGAGAGGGQAEDLLSGGRGRGAAAVLNFQHGHPSRRGRAPCPGSSACSAAWLCSKLLVVGGRHKAGGGSSFCAWPDLL